MIRPFLCVLCAILISAAVPLDRSIAQPKLGQTGFQFLSVGVDARASALADAYSTVEGTSASLFYNPAGLARINGTIDLSVNQHKWIADIQYISGSAAFSIAGGRYGVIGVSYLSVDYGEFLGTRLADNEQGFIDLGSFQPTAVMFGIGYGRSLSENFSIGGQIKYVRQSLGVSMVVTSVDPLETEEKDYAEGVFAFDFGTRYATGYKSLVFGMSVRNFSQEIKYEREGFQLPLTFKFGISMNAFDWFENVPNTHRLLVSIDAVHPRSGPEFISVGGEYVFMNTLAVRGGFNTNDINDAKGFTTGFGIYGFGAGIDYAYSTFDIFADVHRLSLRLTL